MCWVANGTSLAWGVSPWTYLKLPSIGTKKKWIFLGKAKLLSRGGVRGSKVVFLCILIHGSGVLSFCWVSLLTVNFFNNHVLAIHVFPLVSLDSLNKLKLQWTRHSGKHTCPFQPTPCTVLLVALPHLEPFGSLEWYSLHSEPLESWSLISWWISETEPQVAHQWMQLKYACPFSHLFLSFICWLYCICK